jgi:aminopeptidase N
MDRAASIDAPAQPQPIRLADYRPPAHLIDEVGLTIVLGDETTVVRSVLKGRRNPEHGAGAAPIRLDGEAQELVSVTLNGEPVGAESYTLDHEHLELPAVDGAFTLEIESRIKPQENTALEGLYASGGMYCTQCEAEGFRRITYFPDRPDVMAIYTVRIEADKTRYPVLLSNGNRIEAGDLPEGRHYAIWHDPFRKPSYLFAMVAGDLAVVEDSFTTASGRSVALEIFVEHGNEDRCGHAMDSLKRSMKWDEEVYGLEYDLDIFMIVAVSFFNMGAMENKGLNIFNDKLILADPYTATDSDFQRIEAVVAHEYFHNWTGNRVTCRDWFQLSLKEGLTVFRDQEFSSDTHSRGVKRVSDVRLLRAAQFAEDSGPTAHPVRPDSYLEINNFYTLTVYEKGAEVVRMIHTLLGAEAYRAGIDLYFERHDGQAVTCEDFVKAMEDASGHDLAHFRLWYEQAGTPEIKAHWSRDGQGRFVLDLSQSIPDTPGQTDKKPQPIPVRLSLLTSSGSAAPLRLAGENIEEGPAERVLVLDQARQSFVFEDVPDGSVPSLLRGFSAPVRLETDHTSEDLAFLAAKDDDPFGRWEALQTLATRSLLAMVEDLRAGRATQLDPMVIEAARAGLNDDRLEPAFVADLLSLPGASTLGQAMEVWHVDEVHAAREQARSELGRALSAELSALHARMIERAPDGDITTEAMGARALKNACLALLVASGSEPAIGQAVAQADPAGTMTDVMAALAVLNDLDRPEREAALQAFHDRWSDTPLVLDKWFTLSAMSARPDTLKSVKALMEHPGFDLRNPNRVRALIGGFATGNPLRFHARDGSGYDFLAEVIAEIDGFNPQLASRLASPLLRWRRFDADRQAKMTDALRRIAGKPTLSKDVTEVVGKALHGV